MPAFQEDPEPSSITPRRRSTQFPSAPGQQLTKLIGVPVESPLFLAGLGVECSEAVGRSRDVESPVHHQRCAFELAGSRAVLLERRLPMLPLPCDLQLG